MSRHQDRLLTTIEVAAVFRVEAKTVTKWANAGHLYGVRTPGGHWRFRESAVLAAATVWEEGPGIPAKP